LKTRTKKLPLPVPLTRLLPQPAVRGSFLLLFFKKEALSFTRRRRADEID
jgi:hypothetical protein